MKELVNINRSLSALGNVIAALVGKPSCQDIDADDVADIKQRLASVKTQVTNGY